MATDDCRQELGNVGMHMPPPGPAPASGRATEFALTTGSGRGAESPKVAMPMTYSPMRCFSCALLLPAWKVSFASFKSPESN